MDDDSSLAHRLARSPWTPVAVLIGCVCVMWAVEIIDTVMLDDRLQDNGIGPRHLDRILGIIWAPWLHSDYGHVLSNTVPFIALGWLVSLRGLRYWFAVTVVSMVGGGALTWLVAGGSNHIGSSGVVFGYFGALLGAAVFERRPAALAPALVAMLLYSGLLTGLVPQEAISWEGHLFGLIAGFAVSRSLLKGPLGRRRSVLEKEPYAWEADEPWLD